MNVMDHTPLRDLLEDAEARGAVDADEMEAAIAGLDLTEEDEADLRRQLDELDVEVVTVREPEVPDVVEARPRWYHTAARSPGRRGGPWQRGRGRSGGGDRRSGPH